MPDATLRGLIADYLRDLPDDERHSLLTEMSTNPERNNDMSLEAMESEISEIRAKAADLSDSYAQTQAEISADPNLTDSGKTEALAPLHEQLKEHVAALHQREKALVRSKREALERNLYGTSGYAADISGFREAQLIAMRLNDDDEAHEMYVNALRSDDKVLARAIFQQATSGTKGWDKVKREHLARNPSVKTALADLETIHRYEHGGGLAAAVNYMTPQLTTARTGLPAFLQGLK